MTVDEFLAWDATQTVKYEFDGYGPVAMAGGTAAHAAIQANLIAVLVTRLRGNPCRAYGSKLKIRVADSIRYPEAVVVCTPVPPGATMIAEPVVIFEVLSDSSGNDDLVIKDRERRATPSVRQFVVLQQAHAGALVFSRQGENWVAATGSGAEAVLPLPELGNKIPLAEIYDGVRLAGAAAG